MSDAQESAQLLAGSEMPTAVLESLLKGADFTGRICGVCNFTPYDGHLERVCMRWQVEYGQDALELRSFSMGAYADAVAFSERLLGNELLQEREKHPAILCLNQVPKQQSLATLVFDYCLFQRAAGMEERISTLQRVPCLRSESSSV